MHMYLSASTSPRKANLLFPDHKISHWKPVTLYQFKILFIVSFNIYALKAWLLDKIVIHDETRSVGCHHCDNLRKSYIFDNKRIGLTDPSIVKQLVGRSEKILRSLLGLCTSLHSFTLQLYHLQVILKLIW